MAETYESKINRKPVQGWTRRTVADGDYLQSKTIQPLVNRDTILAKGLDDTNTLVNGMSNKVDNVETKCDAQEALVKSLSGDVEDFCTSATEAFEQIKTNEQTLAGNIETIQQSFNTLSGDVWQMNFMGFKDSTTVLVKEEIEQGKHMFSFSSVGGGGGGTSYESTWLPTVDAAGNITWSWAPTTTAPQERNIKGPAGTNGTNGVDGKTPVLSANSYNLYWKYSDATSGWTNLGNFRGEQGENGEKGADGADACPISAKSTDIENGHNVKIFYTSAANPDTNPLANFNVMNGQDGSSIDFNTGANATMSGTGASDDPYGVNTNVLATQTWVENQHYIANVNTTAFSGDGTSQNPLDLKIDNPNINKKYGYQPGTGWTEISEGGGGTDYDIVGNNGVSAKKDTTNNQYIVGLSGNYVNISGDTMTGPLTVSAANGQNMLAVASAATLIGASRQTSAHFGQDTNALGTTWIGVGSNGMHRGFFKYTDGGNVGDLDSQNMMQIEFTPSNKGQIFAKATNNGTAQPETQILNPVKSTVDSMAISGIDSNNVSGPNYMLAKNADGQFIIGAAVINCQGSLPGTLSANAYYFVY